ncbi:MAG: DUF423 domain-containing protein [Nitratireductor sp.]|nr:DUF423 domain-containing protein [Nitratireductor sp.]
MNLERVAAGILGSCGVAAAAASAHGGDQRLLGAVALVCLAHAPALVAISALRNETLVRIAALLLFAGAAMFSADLALRALHDARLFPMAAPTGGIVMILGWLVLTVSGLFRSRQ